MERTPGLGRKIQASLPLIMSDVIWRGKQGLGSANCISLAELQRGERIQREGTGTLCPVGLSQTPQAPGPSAGHRVGWYPKEGGSAKQGLPREGGLGLQDWGEWLPWTRKKRHQRQEASLQT